MHLRGSSSFYFANQVRIPGRRKDTGHRESGGLYTGFFPKTQPCRAVGRHGVGNTVLWNIAEPEGVGRASVWLAAEEMNFHLICQEGNELLERYLPLTDIHQARPFRLEPHAVVYRPGKLRRSLTVEREKGKIVIRPRKVLQRCHRQIRAVSKHTLMELLRCTLFGELLKDGIFFHQIDIGKFFRVTHVKTNMEKIRTCFQNPG